MARIVHENTEALLLAWMAETGIHPSKAEIANQFKDGLWKCWIQERTEEP